MKLIRIAFLFIAAGLLFPLSLQAWAAEGHRICGQIASRYLTPKAQQTIKAILGNESLATASTWADDIKGDPGYHYLQVWHFIDIDQAFTYPQLISWLNHDNRIDAYTRLNFLIYKLKQNQLTNYDRRLLLRLLIHLVEDVNQPLHTGHTHDRGGNDIKLRWFNKPTNLHSVWDYQLISYQHMGYKRYAATIDHPALQLVQQWQQMPVSLWIYESNTLAQHIYKSVTPGQTLNAKYNEQNIAILNAQLLKAGVRLAGILNQLFG